MRIVQRRIAVAECDVGKRESRLLMHDKVLHPRRRITHERYERRRHIRHKIDLPPLEEVHGLRRVHPEQERHLAHRHRRTQPRVDRDQLQVALVVVPVDPIRARAVDLHPPVRRPHVLVPIDDRSRHGRQLHRECRRRRHQRDTHGSPIDDLHPREVLRRARDDLVRTEDVHQVGQPRHRRRAISGDSRPERPHKGVTDIFSLDRPAIMESRVLAQHESV